MASSKCLIASFSCAMPSFACLMTSLTCPPSPANTEPTIPPASTPPHGNSNDSNFHPIHNASLIIMTVSKMDSFSCTEYIPSNHTSVFRFSPGPTAAVRPTYVRQRSSFRNLLVPHPEGPGNRQEATSDSPGRSERRVRNSQSCFPQPVYPTSCHQPSRPNKTAASALHDDTF